MTDAPNLLFVTVDCLRQDFTRREAVDTPFVDQFVEGGLEFTEQYATATTTSPCVASLFTGTYSERNGVNSLQMGSLNDGVDTMAECLSDAGFETAAMVTGPLVGETGVDRGFDHYWYREPEDRIDGEWFDTGVGKMGSLSEPFFLYLHLWEIHDPVRVPEGFDDPRYGRYPYARTLSALDRRLEALCDRLPGNTVIALHGDHGEAIAYRDSHLHRTLKFLRTGLRYGLGVDTRALERRLKRRFDREPPIPDHFMEDGHGENAFDFVANVPFVLHGPGIESATVGAQVRQVDVTPTLLDVAGVDHDGDRMDGESLLPATDVTDRDAYVRACGKSLLREENWQRAVRANGYKYVEYPGRDWPHELYDLDEDPLELHPVEDDRVAARLQRRIPEEGLRNGEKLEIDGLLKDLGYK